MNHFRGYVHGYGGNCRRDRLMRGSTYLEIREDYRYIDIVGMTGLVDMRRKGLPSWMASPECKWERLDSDNISRWWRIGD